MTMYDNNPSDTARRSGVPFARHKENRRLATACSPRRWQWRGHTTTAVKPRLALTGEVVRIALRSDDTPTTRMGPPASFLRMPDPTDGMAGERPAARPAPDAASAAMGLQMGKGYRRPDKAQACVHRLNRSRERYTDSAHGVPVAGAVCPAHARIAGFV